MKIGFLIYSLRGGGAERVVSNLANNFVRQGHDVFIFLFDKGEIEYEIDKKVRVVSCELETRHNKVIKVIKKIEMIRHRLLLEHIDVLLAFMITMIPYALLSKCATGCKVIATERTNPKFHKIKNRGILRFLSGFCDGYIFQTEGAGGCYPEETRKRGVVIGNPVDTPIHEWKKDKGMKICSAGRLHSDKDFFTLLSAFKEFHDNYIESSLTVFGEGPLRAVLEKRTKELHIEDNVFFKGFVRDLSAQISEYSVFVFSSKAEGLPNALMEAMALGIPCIATDCEFGPGELITNGVEGILVKPGNKEELVKGFVWMAEHKKEREKMALKAKQKMERFATDKIVRSYLDYIACIKNN